MTRAHDPTHPWQFMDFQPDSGDQVVREQGFGLTIREHMAALAMQGLCSSPLFRAVIEVHNTEEGACQSVAMSAVGLADALIAELAKSTSSASKEPT